MRSITSQLPHVIAFIVIIGTLAIFSIVIARRYSLSNEARIAFAFALALYAHLDSPPARQYLRKFFE